MSSIFTVCRNGQVLPAQRFIRTFKSPTLRTGIKTTCLSCTNRPYILNTLRCYHYQLYGRDKTTCRSIFNCANCAEFHYDSKYFKMQNAAQTVKTILQPRSCSCRNWIREKLFLLLNVLKNLLTPKLGNFLNIETHLYGCLTLDYSNKNQTKSKSIKHISKKTQSFFFPKII